MKIRELIRFSHDLLKGRRTRTMMICILPLGAELFFRFAEAAVYSMLLYFGDIKPIRLFGGSDPIQLCVTMASTLLRLLTAAPLMYTAAYRLYGMTSEVPKKRNEAFSRILLRKCTFKRSISAALWTKAAGLLALAPAVFFGTAAYGLMEDKLDPNNAFLAANAVFLTGVSVLLWLSMKLSFSAMPYILVRYPKLTAFRAMIFSVGFMRGRKSVPLRLLAVYLPQMLTLAGLPYALTKLMTAYSLSIDIFIKEDEYLEADRAYGRRRNPNNPGKIPFGKKRRIKAAADEA